MYLHKSFKPFNTLDTIHIIALNADTNKRSVIRTFMSLSIIENNSLNWQAQRAKRADLSHSIENRTNQNAAKPLYIRRYYIQPYHDDRGSRECLTDYCRGWLQYFLWHDIKYSCNTLSWYIMKNPTCQINCMLLV